MKKILLLAGLILAINSFCLAQALPGKLAQAEDVYRAGHYAQALTLYEEDLKNYPNDPYLYYNIGNCYFKMGSKGLATANYYRAFMRAPRDLEIRHNLALTRASCGERLVPSGVPEVIHRIYFGLSLAELTGLLFALFWLCCFAGCFWLLKRKGAKAVCVLLVLLLFVTGWWYTRSRWENRTLAVVASPVAEIRSGPGTNFPASANVSQGHLLTIQDSKDTWYEVVVQSQGLKGWVEKNAVEKI